VIAGISRNGWIGLIGGLVVLIATLVGVAQYSKKQTTKTTK